MTHTKQRKNHLARPIRCYAYPNEAEPGYFAGRILDGITAIVTGMGSVTLLLYLLTF